MWCSLNTLWTGAVNQPGSLFWGSLPAVGVDAAFPGLHGTEQRQPIYPPPPAEPGLCL